MKKKPNKLVLIDFSNQLYIVVFSQYLFNKYRGLKGEELSEKDLEGLFRDSLKMIFQKMFNVLEYNNGYKVDMLYAKDGYGLWRRDKIFEGYKSQRSKIRRESPVDFKLVYKIFDKVWAVFRQLLPYRFLEINTIEVDDIIYQVINEEYDKYDKFQIISTDGDFVQLLKYDKVELYNPKQFKFIEVDDPKFELFEKIIRGDKSDNIPNIFAANRDNKQKPIQTKKIKFWYSDKKKFGEWIKNQDKLIKRNFIRNKNLIDLKRIPEEVKDKINPQLSEPRNKLDVQKLIGASKKYHLPFIAEKIEMI